MFLATIASGLQAQPSQDPYLWLETVTGDKALEWVRQQNQLCTEELCARPGFKELRERLLAILDSKEKIPHVTQHGAFLYNFWRDGHNVKGLWRRTSLEEYKKAKPNWERVLDLDALGAEERENWVWKGASFLKPEGDRCLIELSRGGADATVVREFDLIGKEFVPDGFSLSEAKSNVSWRHHDALYVGTDFGPGSLTQAGYPREIKEWTRGTSLSAAKTVFEGREADTGVSVAVEHDHGRVYEMITRAISFFTDEVLWRRGDDWILIDKPADAELSTFGDHLLLRLRSEWNVSGRTYPAGALLGADFDEYIKGERKFSVLFEPSPRRALQSTSATKNFFILTEMDNVRSQPRLLRFEKGRWIPVVLEAPPLSTVDVEGLNPDQTDQYLMTISGYLTPPSLFLGVAGEPGTEKLKSLPSFFDAQGLEVKQLEATSKDGTRVPYFQVGRRDLKLDGRNPTLLYGYGGFEIPLAPRYRAAAGAAWLEQGGLFVVANIRGGGEFGPDWHRAAIRAHRQRAYDDFIAVAEDLIARKVTAPERLGIQGASNGGLLMGVMLTQRPDLFGAVVCGVPLLDMCRYHKLLAGASWMEEYGDPDKAEDWAYLSRFSPFQNVKAGVKDPRVLFYTSTRDDRVHPGHARKMVARMKEQGHDVLYYENMEGGHGAAADNKQAAFMEALTYTFLNHELRNGSH